MKAIISDIHGNLPALEAVLEDIEQKDITEIVCLGDVVGYGPYPRECLEDSLFSQARFFFYKTRL